MSNRVWMNGWMDVVPTPRRMAETVVAMYRSEDQAVMDAFMAWVADNMHPWDALCADFDDTLMCWAELLRDFRPDLLEELTGYAEYEAEYRRVNPPRGVDA